MTTTPEYGPAPGGQHPDNPIEHLGGGASGALPLRATDEDVKLFLNIYLGPRWALPSGTRDNVESALNAVFARHQAAFAPPTEQRPVPNPDDVRTVAIMAAVFASVTLTNEGAVQTALDLLAETRRQMEARADG